MSPLARSWLKAAVTDSPTTLGTVTLGTVVMPFTSSVTGEPLVSIVPPGGELRNDGAWSTGLFGTKRSKGDRVLQSSAGKQLLSGGLIASHDVGNPNVGSALGEVDDDADHDEQDCDAGSKNPSALRLASALPSDWGTLRERRCSDLARSPHSFEDGANRCLILDWESRPGLAHVLCDLCDDLGSSSCRQGTQRSLELPQIVIDDQIKIGRRHHAPPSISLSTASLKLLHCTRNDSSACFPSVVSR
jgi:hypothetical protein